MKKNIGSFEVSVHGSYFVKTFKAINDLFKKICGLILSKSFFSL